MRALWSRLRHRSGRIDGGMATEALIAQVLVAKYSEHLPASYATT